MFNLYMAFVRLQVLPDSIEDTQNAALESGSGIEYTPRTGLPPSPTPQGYPPINTNTMSNIVKTLDPELDHLGFTASYTEHPDIYTSRVGGGEFSSRSQSAGVQNRLADCQENTPTPSEERKMDPLQTSYCTTAFGSEHQTATITGPYGRGCSRTGPLPCGAKTTNPGFGCRESSVGIQAISRELTGGSDHDYVSGVICDEVYSVPYVINGYDHEKALLIRFTTRLYIEKARVAEIAAGEQWKITDVREAEGAQIGVETQKARAERMRMVEEMVGREG